MANEWIVTNEHDGTRLDVYVSEVINGLSRSRAKKEIESGAYLVNGGVVSAHHALKRGDVIMRAVSNISARHITPKREPTDRTQSISVLQLNIIEETPGWIVVYKPHGVLMHPDHDHPTGTIIDAIIEHAPEVAKVGEDPIRPGIVSRLDKDVSGLVIIAKAQDAFDSLKKQFAEHAVEKEYVALVHGEMEDDEGDIKFRIGRSGSKARMAAFPEGSKEGQTAWTHYDVMDRFKGATLLKLQILTGRTHQIRAHLQAKNHPVIGDPLYKPKRVRRNIASPRLLLQSVRLAFRDPASDEKIEFEIDLDEEFHHVIHSLGA